jgi:SAM-dependent methyltransferase
MVNSQQLVTFLKLKTVNSGFFDQLKVSYRPLICPFDDLLNGIGDLPANVMDIGCGSGQFALLLAEFTKVKSISGVEISAHLVANAKELLQPYSDVKTHFEVYNGIDLPVAIQNCDLIFMIDVLHHIPVKNQEIFFTNVFASMRPGSKFIVKDIDGGSPWVLFNKFHDLVFSREIGHEWSMEKVCDVARVKGFRIVETKKRRMYGYPHFTVVLTK